MRVDDVSSDIILRLFAMTARPDVPALGDIAMMRWLFANMVSDVILRLFAMTVRPDVPVSSDIAMMRWLFANIVSDVILRLFAIILVAVRDDCQARCACLG